MRNTKAHAIKRAPVYPLFLWAFAAFVVMVILAYTAQAAGDKIAGAGSSAKTLISIADNSRNNNTENAANPAPIPDTGGTTDKDGTSTQMGTSPSAPAVPGN